jgi:hypothetical integral membrane protein (TIGR02206 family)
MDAAWLHHFEAGSTFHAVMVGACAAVIAAACLVGRRLRRLDRADAGRREPRFAAALGWSIIAWQVFATVWRVLPGQWDVNESLPFHLCRWTGWIAAACLIAGERSGGGWRWSRALMFFWGLGLSVQGFATPMWNDGAATVAFWLYWVGHLQIVGVAVYDLAVRGFVPTGRDLRTAAAAGLGFVLLVMGVNHLLDTNYSYLGAWNYERKSIVDELGPYPERVFKMAGAALVLFVMMFWAARGIAAIGGRTGGRRADGIGGAGPRGEGLPG